MNPRHVHLIAAKHILRYLNSIVDYGLKYKADQKINLEGYVDSEHLGVLLQYGIRCDLLVYKEAFLHGTEYSRSRICHSLFG